MPHRDRRALLPLSIFQADGILCRPGQCERQRPLAGEQPDQLGQRRPHRAALIALYAEASEGARGLTARRFYLTHAYVYALEAGSPEAVTMRGKLVDLGAETLD